MRRYGIARYLSSEQRERAARATYHRERILNTCQRGDCFHLGDGVDGTRAENGSCPLGMALYPDRRDESPVPSEVVYVLSKTGVNEKIRRAAARFAHDVDNGTIGPEDVAVALGVKS